MASRLLAQRLAEVIDEDEPVRAPQRVGEYLAKVVHVGFGSINRLHAQRVRGKDFGELARTCRCSTPPCEGQWLPLLG